MSPGNQGVLQLMKEVTFRGILISCNSRNWGRLGGIHARPGALPVGWWVQPRKLQQRRKGMKAQNGSSSRASLIRS